MATDTTTQVERARIVPRYPFETRFKIRIERTDGLLETEGWSRDLSESGIGAFVAAVISPGETAMLRIPLVNGSDMIIPAVVTRILGTQYGFQFTALSGQQRDQILRLIAGKKA